MKMTTFSSIGGLRLILCNDDGTEIGELKVRREDLSAIACGCISEIGTDASPELLKLCSGVAELSQPDLEPTDSQAAFIAACENEHNASRREHETVRQYYRRLKDTYL